MAQELDSFIAMVQIPFDNRYVKLPERFYTRTDPTAAREPLLIQWNDSLAEELGIDVAADDRAEVFAGNRIPEGAEPIAMAYAGHQFGTFVPQLGDGRAILLGEVVDRTGRRRDLHLKGAGRTPWSRGGDGRAAVGPVLREYIVSEAMHAMGVRTTRSLAAVTTGETVVREELLPGAVLTRVASSHIRVGTFEYFAARSDVEGVRLLADHVIARHYPDAAAEERRYRALLAGAAEAQARLIASWLLVGFIHGVMNTDNMAVSGETIDYGPCAFLDEYDPQKVFSSIDHYGRYAYSNQAPIGAWNLTRLAECLLPLLAEKESEAVDEANAALSLYAPAFERAYLEGIRTKLGLFTTEENDKQLAQDLLKVMSDASADFTLAFRHLSDAAAGDESFLRNLFTDRSGIDPWLQRWRTRAEREPNTAFERRDAMRRTNPLFIPRNHRIEAVIRAAVDEDDFAPFHELLLVLSKPFDEQPEHAAYAEPPQPRERVTRTFCGT